MLKIGLTGGIGSGKSVVAGIFTVLAIPVFDADREAKRIMEEDGELVKSIQQAFGEKVYINGKINRPYLSNIVFNNPDRLQLLNSLVHPVTIKAADSWMNTQHTPYVVKEAALLFELGSASHLDYIIGVHAPEKMRMERVVTRDGVTPDQVSLRMSRQIDETIKMKLCDFVVVNDEKQLLIPQVIQIHRQLIALSSQQ